MADVLALDIATVTGWALCGPNRTARGDIIPLFGSFRAGPAYIGEMEYGAVYVDFRDKLVDLVTVHKPRFGVFEAPLNFAGGGETKKGQASVATVRKLLGLCAIAEETFERMGLEVLEVNVQSVRKHFCNDSRAKKWHVRQTCRALGWNAQDDNAADALAVWDFSRASLKLRSSAGPLYGEAAQ